MSGKRRSPLWAKLVLISGVLLVVTSGTAFAALERYEGSIDRRDLFDEPESAGVESVSEIRGPLNVLLVGLDTRPSRPDEPPRADVVILAHLDEDLSSGYLISLPRDTVVDIPPYEQINFSGRRDRLNAAMYWGARQQPGEESPDVARGFALLSRTVSQLTGIQRFDAGAVINFTGFTNVVDAMGRLDIELDERIESLHRRPDGRHRDLAPGGDGYLGPRMVYEPGAPPCGPERADGTFRCDLNGWQALDIARQRYGVEGGDYGRQRHQQQILRAIADKALSREVVTNPLTLDRVLRSTGDSLIFDGRGHRPLAFALALRDLRPSDLVMVQVDAGSIGSPDNYGGEQLRPRTYELFEALRLGTIDEFLVDNLDLVG